MRGSTVRVGGGGLAADVVLDFFENRRCDSLIVILVQGHKVVSGPRRAGEEESQVRATETRHIDTS